jgi:hypothetical protein
VGGAIQPNVPARGATARSGAMQAVEHFDAEWGGVLPASSESIVRYLAACGAQLSGNTLRAHLAAFAQWHQQPDLPTPSAPKRPMMSVAGVANPVHSAYRVALGISVYGLSFTAVMPGITVFTSRSKKCESVGIRISAPSMFHRNMNVSKILMSAWNLIGDQAQPTTRAAKVTPTRPTTRPVKDNAFW